MRKIKEIKNCNGRYKEGKESPAYEMNVKQKDVLFSEEIQETKELEDYSMHVNPEKNYV